MTSYNYNDIPDTMKRMPHWVLWAAYHDQETGKTDKYPINAISLKNAMSNNANTWTTFDNMVASFDQHSGETVKVKKKLKGGNETFVDAEIRGAGFMLQGSGIVCIDLDHKDNELDDYRNGGAGGVVGDFLKATEGKAYAEISQSGEGVHIFARGSLPDGRKKDDTIGVEMYAAGRFIAMTGDSIPTHYTIDDDCTEILKELHGRYLPARIKTKETAAAPVTLPNVNTSDDQTAAAPASVTDPVFDVDTDKIIKTAGRTNPKFSGLYKGIWQGVYSSQSQADQALTNILCYYTGGNASKIDEIFRTSGLMRDKWDEKHGAATYGQMTIDKAIRDHNGEFFDYNRGKTQAFVNAKNSTSSRAALKAIYNDDQNTTASADAGAGAVKKSMGWFTDPYVLKSNGIDFKGCDYNYTKFLKESRLADNFYLNTFSDMLTICEGNTERPATDDDLINIRSLMLNIAFNECNITKDSIYIAIRSICPRRNPVQDYFNSLHWDGTPRAERLLIDLLGAPDDAYVREATKVFLLGIISRVFNPGTKFDYMIVLQGKQGLGKTAFFKAMAIRPEWYAEIGGAHMQDRKLLGEDAAGKIILEYGELDGIRKTTAEKLKATITRTDDNFRAAYDRLSQSHPRKFVIGGTTNISTYLSDPTGNRRFLPIPITKKGFLTPDEVNQVWAEAYTIYRAGGFKLYLSSDIEEIAETYRANVTQLASDDFVDAIAAYLDDTRTPSGLPIQRTTVKDIFDSLQESTFKTMRFTECKDIIKQALERLGWIYKNKKVSGMPIKAYWRQ